MDKKADHVFIESQFYRLISVFLSVFICVTDCLFLLS
jgi:hypothetical protein